MASYTCHFSRAILLLRCLPCMADGRHCFRALLGSRTYITMTSPLLACIAIASLLLLMRSNLADASMSQPSSAIPPASSMACSSIASGRRERKRRRKRRKRNLTATRGAGETDDTSFSCELKRETNRSSNEPTVCNAPIATEIIEEGLLNKKRKRRRRSNVLQNSDSDATVLLPVIDDEFEASALSSNTTEMETEAESPPEINVSRNETTESITIHDDSNMEPRTYKYTKYSEEETIKSLVHTLESEEETLPASSSGQGPGSAIATCLHSSRRHENIEMSGGGTLKVSKRQIEKRVHITSNIKVGRSSRSKSSLGEPKKAAGSTIRGTGKGGECLRRIKREWKDAARMGIAYDWVKMRTINNRQSCENENNDYVRIGPFGKNLLRWHFSVSGPPNSVYEGGVYHGRVLLPKVN